MPQLTFAELKARLPVDKFNLDQELIEQPVLFMTVAEHLANANAASLAAADVRQRTESEASDHLRTKWTEEGRKITETALKAALMTDRDVVAAIDAARDAAQQAAMWGALKDSFVQRSYLIRDICTLHLSGYFTADSVSARPAPANAPLPRGSDIVADKARKQLADKREKRTVKTTGKKK